MKIKETIITEVDKRGNVIRRTREIDVIDSDMDQRHDDRAWFRNCSDFHQASARRIYEAYEDYRTSKEW